MSPTIIMGIFFITSFLISVGFFLLGVGKILLPFTQRLETARLSSVTTAVSRMRKLFPLDGSTGTGEVAGIKLGDHSGVVQIMPTKECIKSLAILQKERERVNIRYCGINETCLCFVNYNASSHDWNKTPSWLEGSYNATKSSQNQKLYFYNGSKKKPEDVLGPFCEDFFENKSAIVSLQCKEMKREDIRVEGKSLDTNFYWTETTSNCLGTGACHYRYVLWLSADDKTTINFTAKGLNKKEKDWGRRVFYLRRCKGGECGM